jgi:hypothetical protein
MAKIALSKTERVHQGFITRKLLKSWRREGDSAPPEIRLILHRLENVQVLSDGGLGSAELFRQVPDQDPAVPIQDLKDMSVALGSAQVHPEDSVRFRNKVSSSPAFYA